MVSIFLSKKSLAKLLLDGLSSFLVLWLNASVRFFCVPAVHLFALISYFYEMVSWSYKEGLKVSMVWYGDISKMYRIHVVTYCSVWCKMQQWDWYEIQFEYLNHLTSGLLGNFVIMHSTEGYDIWSIRDLS